MLDHTALILFPIVHDGWINRLGRFAMMRLRICFSLFVLSLAVPAFAPPARAQSPMVEPYLPACDDAFVTGKIISRFDGRESEYWRSGLTMLGIEKVGTTAWRPWGASYLPRRFCKGIALLSNGRKHALTWSIIDSNGIIGASWGVEWCIDGLDRHLAHAPHCLRAGP
jgi:hypothetical protein